MEHHYNEGVTTLAPSASVVGIKTITCTGCGHAYTEEIAKLTPEIIERTGEVLKEWYGDEPMTFRSNVPTRAYCPFHRGKYR